MPAKTEQRFGQPEVCWLATETGGATTTVSRQPCHLSSYSVMRLHPSMPSVRVKHMVQWNSVYVSDSHLLCCDLSWDSAVAIVMIVMCRSCGCNEWFQWMVLCSAYALTHWAEAHPTMPRNLVVVHVYQVYTLHMPRGMCMVLSQWTTNRQLSIP